MKYEDKEINRVELYPNIDVYRGMLPDAEEIIRIIHESPKDGMNYTFEDWKVWMRGGRQTSVSSSIEGAEPKEEDLEAHELAIFLRKTLKRCVDDYIERHNLKNILKNPKLSSMAFDFYVPGGGMDFHYDYQYAVEDSEKTGQYSITTTIYINDNYVGGDLLFRIGGEGGIILDPYKPEAGDILLFPAGMPYEHGVAEVVEGLKYFCLTFVEESAAPEWQKENG